MMPSLRSHIVLICVLAGYFITVECRNVIKESYKNSPDINRKKTLNSHSSIPNWLKILLSEGKLKRIGKPNAIKALLAKLIKNEKKNKKRFSKRNLRNGIDVQEFLHKLNNFINQNTHNAYYEKRNDCNFGFGNPSKACKRHKFRRNSVKKSKKTRNNEKEYNNYAQHLVVERAKYRSSSSSSENETPKKSRFKIVDNKRKKVMKESSESEDQSREAYSNEYDDKSNESDERPNESDEKPNGSDEKANEYEHSNLDEDTDSTVENNEQTVKSDESANEKSDRESSVEHTDAKYMYLQGTRLQRPDFRTGRAFKSARRSDRLPHFLPKRFKWDDNMIHNLDAYWKVGINAYDSNKKYGIRL